MVALLQESNREYHTLRIRIDGDKTLSNVKSLHGTTPAEVFESGLENLEDIEAVALSVLWKDGRVAAGWSNMELGALARLILVLDEAQRRRTIEPDPPD